MANAVAFDSAPTITGEYVSLDGEQYFRISNSHLMPEFYMSLVGVSDHWMFISSTGALTAGRCDPDSALFPYSADDQLSVASSASGSLTLMRVNSTDTTWQPWQQATSEAIRRNVYKTPLGNKLVFEEINEELQLAFRYRWSFSEKFGFVRSCQLENLGDASIDVELLDGLQNILPYGVGSDFMMRFSNLANAYKKNELLDDSSLGLYYLSSIPTDRAEPSEGLMATTVWQSGLQPLATLLSTQQVSEFRKGGTPKTERDVRGRAGAYLAYQPLTLAAGKKQTWQVVAELHQDHSEILALDSWLNSSADAENCVESDVALGEQAFLEILASSDALQCTANTRRSNRHLANTVFNVMRGGIPLDDYAINSQDFRQHIERFNRDVAQRHRELLASLPELVNSEALQAHLADSQDDNLIRLGREYLPLAFSRRHGDPTRPWNRFAIQLRAEDGSTRLDYQGNWRDIFQNWEALALSFPRFTTAMVCRFLNATTADGYNPYRVTKDGFEWEEPTPDDPWANIGYWGDHQIIYLLKLLEWNRRIAPEQLAELLDSPTFVHANIPYRIKSFEQVKSDPQDTIEFDEHLSAEISGRVSSMGSDGKLLVNHAGKIQPATMLEKLLTLSLAKLSNFVPDGGLWLNTQRPEWNDANNALVGNGLSMVTTYYLYRWFRFLEEWLNEQETESFAVAAEVADFFHRVGSILDQYQPGLNGAVTPSERAALTEALSQAGSDFRTQLYESGLSDKRVEISCSDCVALFRRSLEHLKATIDNNRRSDGLFHSYNLLNWQSEGIIVEHLPEMLEGQVAVLSSGLLDADESVGLLDSLRTSALYRENQHSYILYPDRQLPRFLDKNNLPATAVEKSPLLRQLLADGNEQIVKQDQFGGVHFNGNIRNAADLQSLLGRLPEPYQAAAQNESATLSDMLVDLFGHRQFTGRSGTFFAYEGLGSIYWHMVSKLALAVGESFFSAIDRGASSKTIESLKNHFQEIRAGIGCEKSPEQYGAFPTDPYSHTPENAGVKQPGMTGQVKEDILSRMLELGIHIEEGCLSFRLDLLDTAELVAEQMQFTYTDLDGQVKTVSVPENGLAFTLCQVPIVYQSGTSDCISIVLRDGSEKSTAGRCLDSETTQQLFSRNGDIREIRCSFEGLI